MGKFNIGDRVIVISTKDGSKMSYDGKHVNCHGTVKRAYKESFAVELDGEFNKHSTSGYFYFKERELKKEDFIWHHLSQPIAKLKEVEMNTDGINFIYEPIAGPSYIDKQRMQELFGSNSHKFEISTDIKNVIFNDPATIVFWNDGSKTVVKCENEDYDPEKGLAMAISKKVLGNKGNYYEMFKKWLPENKELNNETHKNIWMAYHRLLNAIHDGKATKKDLIIAMEEAAEHLEDFLNE